MRDESVDGAIRRTLAGRQGDSSGPCPDANELAAFLEARLAPGEVARFEAHAAGCGACRKVLALALDLAPPAEEPAARKVSRATWPSYRTSPVRLALGAAFALVAGVLLFQAVRDTGRRLPEYQVAREEQVKSAGEGKLSAAAGLDKDAATGQARPTASTGAADAAGAPVRMETRIRAASPEPAIAARPSEPAAGGRPSLPDAAAARPETAKPQAAEAHAGLLKENKAGQEAEGLKDKLAMRLDEQAGKGAKAAEPALPARKETILAQAANEANAAQNANVQRQASNSQLQAANVLYQGANVTSQNAIAGAQAAGDLSQIAKAPTQAADQQAVAAAAPTRGLAMESAPAKAKSVNPVQQAIAEVKSARQQRPTYAMTDQAASRAGKKVGDRIFYRTRDYWVDGASVDHADAPVREIVRDSVEFKDIVKKEPSLAELPGGAPVVLFFNGSNCLIR